MKKRSSVEKANWSSTRDEWYQEESNKILFDRQMNIKISDNNIYLQSSTKEEFFLQISKPKTMWYEIWLKLKNI